MSYDGQHRFYNFGTSGAAVQVAAEILFDLFLGWLLVFVKQRLRHHDHPRGAIFALDRKMVDKRLLQRM